MQTNTPPTPIANCVLVPVTNPATAEELLQVGLTLTRPDFGRIIAAYVSIRHDTAPPGVESQLETLVRKLATAGVNIRLVKETASSVARGILDLATSQRADLIVLGVHQQLNGNLTLGPLVEEVARTTPVHVAIYRGMRTSPGGGAFQQVLVPVDGGPAAELAAQVGLRLTQPNGTLHLATFHHMNNGAKHHPESQQALASYQQILSTANGSTAIQHEVLPDNDLVDGLLHRATPDSLVVLGVSEKQWSRDSWLAWDTPLRFLNDVPGAVILVKQSAREHTSLRQRVRYWLDDLLPTLTPQEHARVAQEGQELVRSTTNFFVLVVLSSLIASLGLLQNSAAVIIGAMLIAPLMSPLMGFALGLPQGKPHLMKQASLTVIKAVVLVLIMTALLGFIWPIKTPTDEMLARGTPSLLDLMVAAFSGVAGAYALARKDVSSALAGVSIAAALMPPLCTVGMAYAFGETSLASGALLLFLTNIVTISLAAAVVFLWMGVRLRLRPQAGSLPRVRIIGSFVVLLVLALPLTISLGKWVQTATRTNTAWVTLREVYGSSAILDVDLQEEPTTVAVIATVRGPRDMVSYEPTDEHIELISQGQDLLRERIGVEEVQLYIHAQPLFSVPGQAPAEVFLADGMLSGFLRRKACANQPRTETGPCDY